MMEQELMMTRLNLYQTQAALLPFLIRETQQKLAEMQVASVNAMPPAEEVDVNEPDPHKKLMSGLSVENP